MAANDEAAIVDEGKVSTESSSAPEKNTTTASPDTPAVSTKPALRVVPAKDPVTETTPDQSGSAEAGSETAGQAEAEVNMQAIENIRKLQRPGKPDIVKKVLNVYFDKSPALVQDIIEGHKAGNLKQVKEAAHSLKSSSAYVGAENIYENCKRIELAADSDALNDVQDIVDDLESSYNAIAANLSHYVENAA